MSSEIDNSEDEISWCRIENIAPEEFIQWEGSREAVYYGDNLGARDMYGKGANFDSPEMFGRILKSGDYGLVLVLETFAQKFAREARLDFKQQARG